MGAASIFHIGQVDSTLMYVWGVLGEISFLDTIVFWKIDIHRVILPYILEPVWLCFYLIAQLSMIWPLWRWSDWKVSWWLLCSLSIQNFLRIQKYYTLIFSSCTKPKASGRNRWALDGIFLFELFTANCSSCIDTTNFSSFFIFRFLLCRCWDPWSLFITRCWEVII